MTHILRIRQSKLTSIYKLRFGKASQKCLQICPFNYYYRTTYKKVSTYLGREFGSYWRPLMRHSLYVFLCAWKAPNFRQIQQLRQLLCQSVHPSFFKYSSASGLKADRERIYRFFHLIVDYSIATWNFC